MKRKCEASEACSDDDDEHDVDVPHHEWGNQKLDVSPSPSHASSPIRKGHHSTLSSSSKSSPPPAVAVARMMFSSSSSSSSTRPVSPDHFSSQHHNPQNQLIQSQQRIPQLPFRRKTVRFANPLAEIQVVAKLFHSGSSSSNRLERINEEEAVSEDTSASASSKVPKSTLFYSKYDYMKFYVRERSRLAFQDLTKRICQEQERRMRSRIRVIPSHFVALNFWNAVMTINELGHQVKQQQQQQQQHAFHQRRRKRRRRRLMQQQSQTQPVGQRNHPVTTAATTRNSRSSSSGMPNHIAPLSLRRHGISLNTAEVKPRPPQRNTVCAAIA